MAQDFYSDPSEYTFNGEWTINNPERQLFYRQVENIRNYLERRQEWWTENVGVSEYLDKQFRPKEPFRPGDIVLFGHHGGDSVGGPFGQAKHSAIVATADSRGLPDVIYDMRASDGMRDRYGATINHSREINGRRVHFRYFYNRYSIIGHGRIVNDYEPGAIPTATPSPGAPEPTPDDQVLAEAEVDDILDSPDPATSDDLDEAGPVGPATEAQDAAADEPDTRAGSVTRVSAHTADTPEELDGVEQDSEVLVVVVDTEAPDVAPASAARAATAAQPAESTVKAASPGDLPELADPVVSATGSSL
jgi:hypothetical protein